MKKIKVIDLINKIYNGEQVPKKIRLNDNNYDRYNQATFEYDENDKMYYNGNADEFYTEALITGFVSIFDEVYIVDDNFKSEVE